LLNGSYQPIFIEEFNEKNVSVPKLVIVHCFHYSGILVYKNSSEGANELTSNAKHLFFSCVMTR